jgi:hypothetical protein
MFGLAHERSDGYTVRRRLPDVARRHLARMPDELQAAHAAWRPDQQLPQPGVTDLAA